MSWVQLISEPSSLRIAEKGVLRPPDTYDNRLTRSQDPCPCLCCKLIKWITFHIHIITRHDSVSIARKTEGEWNPSISLMEKGKLFSVDMMCITHNGTSHEIAMHVDVDMDSDTLTRTQFHYDILMSRLVAWSVHLMNFLFIQIIIFIARQVICRSKVRKVETAADVVSVATTCTT